MKISFSIFLAILLCSVILPGCSSNFLAESVTLEAIQAGASTGAHILVIQHFLETQPSAKARIQEVLSRIQAEKEITTSIEAIDHVGRIQTVTIYNSDWIFEKLSESVSGNMGESPLIARSLSSLDSDFTPDPHKTLWLKKFSTSLKPPVTKNMRFSDNLNLHGDLHYAIQNAIQFLQDRRQSSAILVSLLVSDSFLSPDIHGFVRYPWPQGYLYSKEKTRGALDTLIIGYVSDQELNQVDAALTVSYPNSGGGYFVVQNSWGKNWGDHGFSYVSRNYVEDNALKMWSMTQ